MQNPSALFRKLFQSLPSLLTAVILSVVMFSMVNARGPMAVIEETTAMAPEAVTITATKTDSLFIDVDGDSQADSGDTLQYTVVVANSGDTDALNTLFTDVTDDSEVTVVAGSLRATPIGTDDAYSVIGNTHITHPAGTGLLNNDLDPDGGALTASCSPCTTTNGGTVTLNSDGSFTYNPPVGFTGSDTFTYTVTDPHSLTDTGTVTFTVVNRIWWVDSNAAGAGSGTSTDPFQALASAQTASLINDTIFIYSRGANYTAGFVLKNDQKLCGHGASLATCSGLTAPAGTTFPSTSTNPTIVNTSSHVITLAQNNTIHGMTLGNSGAAANFAISGANFGNLNIQTVTINTNNGALSLSTGTATASFTSTTSAGGTNNVTLTSVNGNIILGSGALTGASGNAVNIVGGTAAFSTTATITNNSAKAVNIQSKTGGTASFSGSINSTSGGTGITLLNNTGATFTFAGGMTLNTGANTAFSATGGGTVSVMTGIHTAATTTATAVNIQNMNIGVGNILFRSISSDGGANPGLILNNLTGGTFTVVGTGPDGSGGTIQNKTGDAIQLTSVTGVSLNHMNITNIDGNGIAATSVTNLGINNNNFTDIADTFTPDEAALLLTNLAGTNSFTNSTITNAFDDQIFINQSGSTTLALFTISNNIFTGHAGDNDAIRYQGIGTTNGTVAITGNTFTNSDGDFIQATLEGSANLNLTVGGAGGSANSFTNTGAFTPLAGGITLSPGGGAGWTGRLDFDINNNTISNANTQGVNINLLKPATSGATIDGFVRNNTISNTNNNFGGSIQVTNGGLVSQVTVEISGNTITGDKGTGAIYVIGDQGGTVSTGARTDIRVLNNSVSAPSNLNTNAIHLNSSTTSSNTGTVVCWDMQNNNVAGGGFSGTDTRIRQRFSSQVILPSYGGTSADTAAVQAYITGRGNTGVVSAATQAPGGYFSGTCNAPTLAQMTAAYAALEAEQPNTTPEEINTQPTNNNPGKSEQPSYAPTLQPTPFISIINAGSEQQNNNRAVEDIPGGEEVTAEQPAAREETTLAPEVTTTVGPFTLPAGEQTTITFQVLIQNPFPSAQNPICNQATISGSNFSNVLSDDPDVAGTANPTCTTVQINADLSITKTDGQAIEIPGTSVTYTIVASNAGPNPDPAAVVADTFPAAITGVTWTCVGAGGGTCTASGSGNINETVNLPVGGSVTFTATGTISPAATGSLVNTATVTTSSGITDLDPANNSATDTDTLTPQADLSITKTDGVATATPGGSVTYTITASNAGSSDAPSVTVADTFPAILTAIWTCVGAGGGTCTAGPVAGNINDTVSLPAGGSVTYTVNATISPTATGSLSNTATVSSGVTDPDPANNSATDTDTLTPQADLSITKTDGVATATPGGSVTYTITASNAGPSDAPSVTVADTFPAILTAIWTCVGAGGGTCTAGPVAGNINDTVSLPAGGSVTYTVNATISPSATGSVSNTATVSSSVTDPDPANNSATDTDTLTPQADLSITKTDGVATATPGGSVTYTITASNAGPSDAPSVTVADTFPAILTATWTCVGAGGGTCTAAGSGNINDTVTLPAGGSVTYTVNASIAPSATGSLVNTATVSSGVTDPDPANNSATDTDTLTPQADVSITKTDGQTTDTPGTSIAYTIVASNPGPSNAPSVTVADTFPASITGVTWTCVGAGGGTCTAAGSGNINDTVNLPAGGSVTYMATGTIDASATGTLSNTATASVGGGVTDPNSGNNSATDNTTLISEADLTITKADSAEPVFPGNPLTYTLSITNNGPSNALNAIVTDTLPVEVTWTGDTCTAGPPTGQTLIWNVGTLNAGASASCEVYVTVNTAGSGTIVNTVVIGSDVFDPNAGNNTDSEPTTTNTPPTLSNLAVTSPINENGTATLTGNISDPDAGDTFQVVIEWGNGISTTQVLPAGTTTFTATQPYVDDDPSGTPSDNFNISVTLYDSAGNDVPGNAILTVNNVAPTLSNVAMTASVNENGTATLTGNLSDPGPQDTFTLSINWGDGNVQNVNLAGGSTAFNVTHTYLDDNPTGTVSDNYTVSLTLTDDDTGSDTDSTSLTVNNVAPALSGMAATATNENGTTTLSGTITDPGTQDTFSLVVDWGDGSAPQTFNYAAGTTSFNETHLYLDDNPTGTSSDNYTIGLTLTDDDTGTTTGNTSVTVSNVAPTLSNVAITSAVNEGDTATLSGNIADPGTLDTFSLMVDWGDGSTPQTFNYAAGTTSFSETHVYADDNPSGTPSDSVTVSLTLTDDDTGQDTDTASVTVSNVAPTLSNVAITSVVNEGGTATLSGDIADSGSLDTFSLVVDWGDGSAPETFNYVAGTTSFSEAHVYADDNPTGTPSDSVTVSLTLTDDDTGQDTDTASITVSNVAPTLSSLTASTANENAPTTLSGTITDPGTGDTFTLVVAWGDGTVVTTSYPAGSTTFSENHTYPDDNPTGTPSDTYTVSISITDDDTGTGTGNTTATVNNVAPALGTLAASPTDENGISTLSGTITDASALDSFSLAVNWGDGTVLTYTYPAGTTGFSETHQYLDDDPTGTPSDAYAISLTLTDDDTGSSTGNTTATVSNLPPTLSNLTVTPVDENNTATLTGLITDTGTLDTFTLLVDWGDGVTETFAYATAGAFTETHTYLDGFLIPLSTDYTVTLTLTDDDTGQDTGTVGVTIANVPPVITSLAAISPIDENGETTLIGTFNDPGSQDTFTVVVDWGDGSVLTATYPAGAFDFQHTHQFLDDDPTATPSDTYSITVTLMDDDGGTDTDGTAVLVNNLAPAVNVGPDQAVADTAPVTFTGVFTDVGTLDTHTILWDFGDGVTMTGTLTPTHTFPGVGTYTVTLSVTDDDTGQGNDSLTVIVLAAADLSLTKQAAPDPVLSGTTLVYTLTVTNNGPSDATGVLITDTLPANVTFASASAGCTETGGVVTCAVGNVANGTNASVQILVTVDVDYEGLLTNTALVGSVNADPNASNDTASATVEAVATLIVFEDDFEDPPINDEWGCATPVTTTTPLGGRTFLGEFGPETVCLNLDNLPQHTTVTLEFDLFIIRSWDGNQIDAPENLMAYSIDSIVGPDYWLLAADGTTLIATTFTNWADLQQGYPGNLSMASYSYPAWTGAEEVGTLGYEFFGNPQDAVYHMEFTFAHTGETLDLEFISQQLQGILDESWGIDNVVVSVSMTDSFGETYTLYLPIVVR